MEEANISLIVKYFFPTNSKGEYAALTSGLSVFLVLMVVVDIFTLVSSAISLNPKALFHLNLNRLTNYPLAHMSLLHLLLNIMCLYKPLADFEFSHGTVYTGITLNILALVTAVPFCILGIVFYPNTNVIGASGWVFSLAAFDAQRKSRSVPVYRINSNFAIPTLYIPVVFLLIVTFLFPVSSFWGHLFGLIAGYLLGSGHLNKLIQPPLKKVVPFIESKLDFLINKIPSPFVYLKEEEIASKRMELRNSSIIPLADTGANKRQSMPPTPATEGQSAFQGQGHLLSQ